MSPHYCPTVCPEAKPQTKKGLIRAVISGSPACHNYFKPSYHWPSYLPPLLVPFIENNMTTNIYWSNYKS